ncbi:MAG: hypothetical protein D6793_01515 [Thermoflexia bacterium]|nr:MAG: hypothetical protein D6793_01515 [Thermoflexia bacterium]
MSEATQPTLYMALELSEQKWHLAFTIGLGQPARERIIPAGDPSALQQEIARARLRFGLPDNARILSCYEAGREGFWLHLIEGGLAACATLAGVSVLSLL